LLKVFIVNLCPPDNLEGRNMRKARGVSPHEKHSARESPAVWTIPEIYYDPLLLVDKRKNPISNLWLPFRCSALLSAPIIAKRSGSIK